MEKSRRCFLPFRFKTGFNTNRWILNGEYECGEIDIIKQTLQPNDVVFEISTGLSFISSYCAKVTGNEYVFTYEANTNNMAVIKSVFNKNKVTP